MRQKSIDGERRAVTWKTTFVLWRTDKLAAGKISRAFKDRDMLLEILPAANLAARNV